MKTLVVSALIILSACCFAFAHLRTSDRNQAAEKNEPAGFAVLELFTSEGCSSCPGADKLLGTIQEEYHNKPVYVLAYHVDYWDRQGWTDAFSDAAFTNRQLEYSQLLKSQMYTPQLVVNGQREFVGSDEKQLRKVLGNELSGDKKQAFSIHATRQTGTILIRYSFDKSRSNDVLRIVVVQKQAIRNIKRGENQGRTLTHWQIVRQLYNFDLDAKNEGTKQLLIPKDFNTNDWEIIGMIQNPVTGKIVAAHRAEF